MKNFTRFREYLIKKSIVSKKLLLILFFCPIITFSQWTLEGSAINGEAVQDWSGNAISISTDGNVLAVGAVNNDGNGFNSGHVRVYQNISGVWAQIGNDIDGEAANDYSTGINLGGYEPSPISLNSDGSILAIGAPSNNGNGTSSGHVRVFENVSGNWIQLGQDIDGVSVDEWFGFSVDLNSDGTILAVGARQAPWVTTAGGLVRVYELISGTWIQRGADIIAEGLIDGFGSSISINANGNVIAIGAPYNDGSATDAGHVRIYAYSIGQNRNVQGTWSQLGSDIDGEAISDRFGSTVSIDASGNIVAIGAKFNNNNGAGSFSGHVRVYERISSVWTQIGSDIDSSAQGDEFGYSVSISAAGTRVAAGARLNDGGGGFNAIGHVRIFDNISSVWTQVHSEIIGAALGNEFGTSVSISGDGSMVAIGAPKNGANGLNAGQARVYKDPLLGISGNTTNQQLSIYPNPTSNYFEIETIEALSQVEIYTIQGQSVKSFLPQNQYNISDLSSGIYFVKIQANTNEITKRIIKE